MRKWLLPLLLLVLLAGCAKEPQETTVPPTTADPGQILAPGLTAWPLEAGEQTTVSQLGEHLLLITTGESQTQLRLVSPDSAQVLLEVSLQGQLSLENGGIQLLTDGVAYYSESTGELVLLNANLRQMRQIQLPQGYLGIPCIDSQATTIFYSTQDQVRALELRTGVDRLIFQGQGSAPLVVQVLLDGELLRCDAGNSQFQILCGNTGRLYLTGDGAETLETQGQSYFLRVTEAAVPELIFGTGKGIPQTFWGVAEDAELFSFPEKEMLLTLTDGRVLERYDLATGSRNALLELELPLSQLTVAEDGCIWFYSSGKLCRWDPAQSPAEENGSYTETRFTQDQPNLEALAQWQQTATALGDKYGVEILIGSEAAQGTEQYLLEPEHLVQVYEKYLPTVEAVLAQFPEGFFQTVMAGTGGKVSIGLVRSVSGIVQQGTVDRPQGLQFWQGGDAYIRAVLGEDLEAGLYHQIMHVLDSRVLSLCAVYDGWKDLNPQGFVYDESYIANLNRQDTQYLEGENAAFVDLFSMSFPREDRAGIFEKACQPGNEELFSAPILQKKLQLLCKGIRQAFGLKTEEALLWEQYLQ